MNKNLIIGVGVAATLVAAYFIFKPKDKKVFAGNGDNKDPFEPVPPVEFKCKFPLFPCPNNSMKCYNPLLVGQKNECGNVLS